MPLLRTPIHGQAAVGRTFALYGLVSAVPAEDSACPDLYERLRLLQAAPQTSAIVAGFHNTRACTVRSAWMNIPACATASSSASARSCIVAKLLLLPPNPRVEIRLVDSDGLNDPVDVLYRKAKAFQIFAKHLRLRRHQRPRVGRQTGCRQQATLILN